MAHRAAAFHRIGGLLFSLGLAATFLVLWLAALAPQPALAAAEGGLPAPAAPLSATIRGTVSYSGTITGTHLVWVGAFTTTAGGPPPFSTVLSGTGAYTLTVDAGTYYLFAGMDGDDSGGDPNPLIDPMGEYAGNPVTVGDGAVITGVDITLQDPAVPAGAGSISGQIFYTGQITGTHNFVIFASRVGIEEPPLYAAVIPGPGPYTLTYLLDYTYTVAAFIDLDNDMGPPEPGEPFAWYDPGEDGLPDYVVISQGNAVTGIDITLRDPFQGVYLPLVRR